MKRVLFLCTGNSCRSQLAEVLLNHYGKGQFVAQSAGSKPAGYVHPLALRILERHGLPALGLRSKSWDEFRQERFDLVVTVCGNANETCPIWPGATKAHWGFADPAEAQGTDEQKLVVFERVFKQIQSRIQEFVALPAELAPEEWARRVVALGKQGSE